MSKKKNKNEIHELPCSKKQYEQAEALRKRLGRTFVDLREEGLRMAAEWADKPLDAPLPNSMARRRKEVKKKQKTCGKCGQKGHNARTCGGGTKGAKRKRSQNTCGKCGGKGHNARTCKK